MKETGGALPGEAGQGDAGAATSTRRAGPVQPVSRLISGGLFVIGLIFYISTLAPSVVTLFDDSLEFQLVTYRLGIAHPTGYPLYTILGKLFTFLPVGDVAYRVNLMSAVFGAATVALVYNLIIQVAASGGARLGERLHLPLPIQAAGPSWPLHLGGVIGAALFAVSPVFWQQATIAEVYTLNAFFVALILLLALTLPAATPEAKQRRILWLAFVTGLSLTHHRTMLLLLPALALYLYLIERSLTFKPKTVQLNNSGRRRTNLSLSYKNHTFVRKYSKTLLLGVLLGLAPLLLYLYLPWRGHIGSLDGTYQNTWTGFWQQVSASGYGAFIFDNPFGNERPTAYYWELFENQFYSMAPGFIGLIYLLWRGRRSDLVLTGGAFLSYIAFNLFYNVSDIDVFFSPNFLIWAVWSGLGAAFLLSNAASIKSRWGRPLLAGSVTIIFALIALHLVRTNLPPLTESHSWRVHDYGIDILQQPLPSGGDAVVVGILGEMTLLRYFQQTEHWRPDVKTVAADLEAQRLAVVEDLLAQGKSVYLTRELAGAPERWSLNAVGPLIRVDPEPVKQPPDVSFYINQPVASGIELVGYDLSRPPYTGTGPTPVRLTVYWQAMETPEANLKVSARLLDAAGEPVAVVDTGPVHFAYPTSAWRSGEIVSDVYDLLLPVDSLAGQYTPLLIWYDPAQNAAEVGRIELAPISIE